MYLQAFVTTISDVMTSPCELGVGDGTVHIRRVVCAADGGKPVNSSIVEAQIADTRGHHFRNCGDALPRDCSEEWARRAGELR